MKDIWGFLVMTLQVSSVALLVLLFKRIFRDKLPPRWQFAIWVIPFLVAIMPFTLFHGGILFDWHTLMEMLKTSLTGAYSLSPVNSPLPLFPDSFGNSFVDWLYIIYLCGIVVAFVRYIISYVRLKRLIARGKPVGEEDKELLEKTAEKYHLPVCRAVTIDGISSAFVAGLFKPVLVLPSHNRTDEKVFLHELLHLKYHDAWYGVLIAFIRCVHWCNPFLYYCCNRAENDLESWCDQRVMERLEGEERRTYGKILLSMTDEQYARMPGTTSIANGGKNIRRRIENIVRFKKYPKDMGIVQVCIVIALFVSLFHLKAYQQVHAELLPEEWKLATARVENCGTAAEALDTYAKAVIYDRGVLRAASAPLDIQQELVEEMEIRKDRLYWDGKISFARDELRGYAILNPEVISAKEMHCSIVVALVSDDINDKYAVQEVSVSKIGNRWSVMPLSSFETCISKDNLYTSLYSLQEMPVLDTYSAVVYTAENDDVKVTMTCDQYLSLYSTIYVSPYDGMLVPSEMGKPIAVNPYYWVVNVSDISCEWKKEQMAEEVTIRWGDDQGVSFGLMYDVMHSMTLMKEDGYHRVVSTSPAGIDEESLLNGTRNNTFPASFVVHLETEDQPAMELKMERTGDPS